VDIIYHCSRAQTDLFLCGKLINRSGHENIYHHTCKHSGKTFPLAGYTEEQLQNVTAESLKYSTHYSTIPS